MKRIAFLPLALVPLLAAALRPAPAPESTSHTFLVAPVGMRSSVPFTATAVGGTLEVVVSSGRRTPSADSVVETVAPATLRASGEVRFLRVVTEGDAAVRVLRTTPRGEVSGVLGWGRRILLRRDGDAFIPRSQAHFLDPR
ncbi:MAG TPA: hypothetical protein VHG91_09140 [Longimicrobium sp.]|nr:hypothetical protein [Longimicrobium sp.]